MLYLLLNIVFASTFTLCIKWVQVREREDILIVGAINYLVAAALILPVYVNDKPPEVDAVAIATGLTMGACYFIAFFALIHTVRWIGAAASTVIGALSIMVPIAAGIFVWNEQPNGFQVVGITMAFLAMTLIGRSRHGDPVQIRPWFAPLIMVSFFLLAGLNRLSQEAFKHLSQPDQRPTFLLAAFLTTAVPSLALLVARRRRLSSGEILIGTTMGLANILQSHAMLKSLENLDGFVVFPVASAGGLMLTTVVATKMLAERLNRQTQAGIAIAVLALVLLNWLP
jgi:drug/metabolite transporter (DMT)-like permease